eukprot:1701209-Amphidinium_carterae.1
MDSGHESPGTESEQPSHLTLDASTSSLSKYIKEVTVLLHDLYHWKTSHAGCHKAHMQNDIIREEFFKWLTVGTRRDSECLTHERALTSFFQPGVFGKGAHN